MSKVTDYKLSTLTGGKSAFEDLDGKALLLVNVASECGLTPQYEGLQKLHEKYSDKGLAIVGIPCNQFGAQEPGSPEQIGQFCQKNYGVSFTIAEKIEVNGEGRHPLYEHLAGDNATFPGDITWNFEKFLIGRDGSVLSRFAPTVNPEDEELTTAIEGAL